MLPIFRVSIAIATSGGSSSILNLDVRDMSFALAISPLLARVSLSSEIYVAPSSKLNLPLMMSVRMESRRANDLVIEESDTTGLRSIWRQLILSPRLSISWMIWNPNSDSTIFDTLLGDVRLNATLANAGSRVPRPEYPSSPP